MTQSAIATAYGREWNARAALDEAVQPIAKIAFGDGVRVPVGNETTLLSLKHTALITAHGFLEGSVGAYFDAALPVGVGGFVIREVALLTADDKIVAIGHRDPAMPITEADDLIYRFEVFYDNLDALVVQIAPIVGLSDQRQINTDTGLSGGGNLAQDRTHRTDWSNLAALGDPLAGAALLNVRQANAQASITLDGLGAWLRALLDDDGDEATADFVTFDDLATADDAGIVTLNTINGLIPTLNYLTYADFKADDPATDGYIVTQATLSPILKMDGTAIGLGESALASAVSGNTTAIGHHAGRFSSAGHSTFFGSLAGYRAEGSFIASFGGNAAYNAVSVAAVFAGWRSGFNFVGNYAAGAGTYALENARGHYATAFGNSAGDKSVGHNVAAFGARSARDNVSANVSALGYEAGNTFTAGPAKDAVRLDSTQLTVNAHGFGSTGSFTVVRFADTTTTLPGGISSTAVYSVEIVSANAIKLIGASMSTDGVDVKVEQNVHDQTNSTILGAGAQASGPNEVRLGNASVTDVKTDGIVRTTKGFQNSPHMPSYRTAANAALYGAGGQAAFVDGLFWTDGSDWFAVGSQVAAARGNGHDFGFSSVTRLASDRPHSSHQGDYDEGFGYVFDAQMPDTNYVVSAGQLRSYTTEQSSGVNIHRHTAWEVSNKTVNGFDLVIKANSATPDEPEAVLVVRGV